MRLCAVTNPGEMTTLVITIGSHGILEAGLPTFMHGESFVFAVTIMRLSACVVHALRWTDARGKPRPVIRRVLSAFVLVGIAACTKEMTTEPEVRSGGHARPSEFGDSTYVSSEQRERDYFDDEEEEDRLVMDGYAVTSRVQVRSLADAAAEPLLGGSFDWKSSPILPAAWPEHQSKIAVLYYPMSIDPVQMSRAELHSAAVQVTVALTDGAVEVAEMNKRSLGMVENTRAARLEREELEMSETALVHLMLAHETEDHGENHFWGYLKYFHEHPKFAGDIKRRMPDFVDWVEELHHGRR